MPKNTVNTCNQKVNILCLHGKEQSREILRTRLGKLPHHLRDTAAFHIIDAPFELELRDGQSLPGLAWFHRHNASEVDIDSLLVSLDYVHNAWHNNESGIQYDGILGFSQGGTLTAIIALLHEYPSRLVMQHSDKCTYKFDDLKFSIHIGAPDIPYNIFRSTDDMQVKHIRSLHLAGTEDKAVPIASSRRLSERFASMLFLEHPMGHCIPSKKLYFEYIKDFITTISSANNNKRLASPIDNNESKEVVSNKAHEVFNCTDESIRVLQNDEVEAILSIYPEIVEQEITSLSSIGCPVLKVNISCLARYPAEVCETINRKWVDNIYLTIRFTASYPVTELPLVEIYTDSSVGMSDFTKKDKSLLLSALHDEMEMLRGNAVVYELIIAATSWIANATLGKLHTGNSTKHNDDDTSDDDDGGVDADFNGGNILWELWDDADEEKDTERIVSATIEAYQLAETVKKNAFTDSSSPSSTASSNAYYSSSCRGIWRYTIGLIGKPSAGKSTFYNAATKAAIIDDSKLAAVGFHPFTTIEPNVSTSWYHHSSLHDSRYLPILIKDVAGLVPGSYKGRGKGNRFLNDLCSADVLIHVVDSTGKSDRDGNIIHASSDIDTPTANSESTGVSSSVSTALSSPIDDSDWIRQELHRWIYNNVKAKWASVCRRRGQLKRDKIASRVNELFTGYQGTKDMLESAAKRVGLILEEAQAWTPLQLHKLVANFLSIRFPICLALNKIDSFGDCSHGIEVLQECCRVASTRGEVAVPLSAKADSWLIQKQTNKYSADSKVYIDNEACLDVIHKHFLPVFTQSNLGVMNVLNQAVMLKPPVLCYPVASLDHESSLRGDTIKDCLLLKQYSTVEDVYNELKRSGVVSGDFIRAEARGLDVTSRRKQVGKDNHIDSDNCVIRIYTNRKSSWQQKNSVSIVT